MKKFFLFIWETLKITIIALVIVFPIRYFIFQPFFVEGRSMEPNFKNSDYLIIDEISYRLRDPYRGEVIVFKYPQSPSDRYIKRIIGLPGETIEIKNGKIIIFRNSEQLILNEKEYLSSFVKTSGELKITLGEDEYFVLGDNREKSFDSRRWGVLPEKYIIGRVFLRGWPIESVAKIKNPEY